MPVRYATCGISRSHGKSGRGSMRERNLQPRHAPLRDTRRFKTARASRRATADRLFEE